MRTQSSSFNKRHHALPRFIIGGIMVLLVLAGVGWTVRPDEGRLHVLFLDTPGDAILIQTPRRGYVLIDGGSDPTQLALQLGTHLPFWQRTLDMVLLTHPSEARLPGQVAALTRYYADMALIPPDPLFVQASQSPSQQGVALSMRETEEDETIRTLLDEWMNLVTEQEIPVHVVQVGERFDLGGAVATVLATGIAQESGIILHMQYGQTTMVLALHCAPLHTSFVQSTAYPVAVVAYPWACDMDRALFDAWRPQHIIFMPGDKRDDPALLTYAQRSRYSEALPPAHIYHQRINGMVEVVSDGRRVWVE